ncbi:GL19992, partial [Drosophila persimilis]
GFGHFLSCAYLEGLGDDEPIMQERRKRLHRQFSLPVTRPYFRRANQCHFQGEVDDAPWTPLLNTHVGVRPSAVTDGKEYLVNGNYHYYHYLQQQVQDKGWGCAYRSLQTICSWFVLQGYTNAPIPTHLGGTEVPAQNKRQAVFLRGFLPVDWLNRDQHVPAGIS